MADLVFGYVDPKPKLLIAKAKPDLVYRKAITLEGKDSADLAPLNLLTNLAGLGTALSE